MSIQEINNLNSTEIFNKIEVTKASIKKSTEHLKWNPDADFLRPMIERRTSELIQLQNRLDTLFENAN